MRYEEPKEPTEEAAARNYDDLVDKLRARLGKEHVATEASAGRTAFREEWGGTLDATVAVVRPVSMREVADVLRLCVDIGMPVSPGEDPEDAFARRGARVGDQSLPKPQPHVLLNMRRPVIQAGQRDKFFDSEKITLEELKEADANAQAAGQADNT